MLITLGVKGLRSVTIVTYVLQTCHAQGQSQ